jgi:hypothetical protein
MMCSPFTAPAFGPVRLDLRDFVCVFECMLIVLLGGICRRSVRVEDVVGRFDLNCLREFLTENTLAYSYYPEHNSSS